MLRIDGGPATYTPAQLHTDPPSPSGNTQQGNTPQNVTQPSAPPSTPAQTVDQAVAGYKAAVASGDQNAINKARQDVYTAVRNEVGPQVDAANRNIPPEFQTPMDAQITSYGTSFCAATPTTP